MHEFLRLVASGELDQVRLMLQKHPELVNANGPHPYWGGRPQPLHVAVETKRRDMIQLLLDAGADPNGDNDEYDGWSPLMLAVHRELKDVQLELIRRGARPGLTEALLLGEDSPIEAVPQRVPNGGSWLNFARTEFAVERLIELGASLNEPDRWGTTPAMAMSALGVKGRPLLDILVSHGATATAEDFARLADRDHLAPLIAADPSLAQRDSIMVAAVDSGDTAFVQWLLENKANPNARAAHGSKGTVLHNAAWRGDLPMVQVLVKAGADVNALDEEHANTPLGWAETAVEFKNDPSILSVVEYLRRQPF